MNNLTFEGNSAFQEGNTLYLVWKSTSTLSSEQFGLLSIEEWNEEAKVKRWNGKNVTLNEFVSEGWMNGFAVCTQIDMSENVGKMVVAVKEKDEENGEEGCVVGMEGGEVSGEVEMGRGGAGEVNGEGVMVDMGSDLTEVLQKCEDIQIMMNVTYGLSNG